MVHEEVACARGGRVCEAPTREEISGRRRPGGGGNDSGERAPRPKRKRKGERGGLDEHDPYAGGDFGSGSGGDGGERVPNKVSYNKNGRMRRRWLWRRKRFLRSHTYKRNGGSRARGKEITGKQTVVVESG